MQEFITNDNVTLKYIDTLHGNASSPPKPVLLLVRFQPWIAARNALTKHQLHGFTGSSLVFKKNIPALSEKYRIIAPDLRGHGESEKLEWGYHVSRLAMDLRELILHLERHAASNLPISAIGASLGCAILWCYAELFTTRAFMHMIFVDQAPLQNSTLDGWDDQYCNRSMNSPAALAGFQATLENDPETAHRGTIAACLGYRWDRRESDDVSEETEKADEQFFLGEAMKGNERWFGKLMADHTALDWRDSIMDNLGWVGSRSTTKVLVVASTRSGCFPEHGPLMVVKYVNGDRSGADEVRDRARGVVVDWGGHWCYWEKPKLFNKLVLDFLDGNYANMAELAVDNHVWTSVQ